MCWRNRRWHVASMHSCSTICFIYALIVRIFNKRSIPHTLCNCAIFFLCRCYFICYNDTYSASNRLVCPHDRLQDKICKKCLTNINGQSKVKWLVNGGRAKHLNINFLNNLPIESRGRSMRIIRVGAYGAIVAPLMLSCMLAYSTAFTAEQEVPLTPPSQQS